MEKRKRQQQQNAEDAVFHRMLLWLAAAVAVELLVLLVKRLYVEADLSDAGLAIAVGLSQFFTVFRFAGLVLIVAGAAWTAVEWRGQRKVGLPLACTGILVILWIITIFAYYLFEQGLRILTVLPVVGAVLILVYFLYQRSFFINALLTGGGMAALWLYRQYYSSHPTAVIFFFAAGWILLALTAVMSVRLRQSGGKLGFVRMTLSPTSYIMLYLTCGIIGGAMLLGMVLGASVAYYLIFILIGWLFCQAVYYTVKLM